jgi:hypothetical protein
MCLLRLPRLPVQRWCWVTLMPFDVLSSLTLLWRLFSCVLAHAQGDDDVGRPLLERALVIQEKALGPDHPDVIAIKDVLNSDWHLVSRLVTRNSKVIWLDAA